MSTISDTLNEIMQLPVSYRGKLFYHGTSSVESARGIIEDGFLRYRARKHSTVPPDRVYLTTDLPYALTYALETTGGRYGYVFTVTVEALLDIQPDEDDVGRLVQRTYDMKFKKGKQPPIDEWTFLEYAWDILTRKEKVDVIQGEFGAARKVGVRLLEKMPPRMILWFLQRTPNLSHNGEIVFKDCYRIEKRDKKRLSRDASNFLDLATKVESVGDLV